MFSTLLHHSLMADLYVLLLLVCIIYVKINLLGFHHKSARIFSVNVKELRIEPGNGLSHVFYTPLLFIHSWLSCMYYYYWYVLNKSVRFRHKSARRFSVNGNCE